MGRFRRTHLVPVPRVGSLAQFNRLLAAADAADERRHVDGRLATVGERGAAEVAHLRRLPDEPFETTVQLRAKVDGKARIWVNGSYYSVPVGLAGRELPVALAAPARSAPLTAAASWRTTSAAPTSGPRCCCSTTTSRS